MESYTTIQLFPGTRDRLSSLKASPRETYDELLNKLLELVPSGDDEGSYSDDFKLGLLNARLNLKKGKTVSHEEVKRRLGL